MGVCASPVSANSLTVGEFLDGLRIPKLTEAQVECLKGCIQLEELGAMPPGKDGLLSGSLLDTTVTSSKKNGTSGHLRMLLYISGWIRACHVNLQLTAAILA
ncbi:hypothetical protein NDU88_004157 [Pleurodeles waltl]|uniref:Uncharacterized protein n=1 Tax=Pleurodeles waltl TaxID=8319 RepID=A0AAV7MWN7_PLEWA|nr:hypothetical protein NDU88_004157 [Pleurodeles waltl]